MRGFSVDRKRVLEGLSELQRLLKAHVSCARPTLVKRELLTETARQLARTKETLKAQAAAATSKEVPPSAQKALPVAGIRLGLSTKICFRAATMGPCEAFLLTESAFWRV